MLSCVKDKFMNSLLRLPDCLVLEVDAQSVFSVAYAQYTPPTQLNSTVELRRRCVFGFN